MKKFVIMMLLLVGSLGVFAQNWQEVVYLKNGSVVRGVVVEQVPGASLKIQTADGSLFVFQMSEVDKITKELPKQQVQQTVATTKKYVIESAEEAVKNEAAAKTRGYRGFVDGGFTAGYDFMVELINTSHGYQINPHFFVGGGMGLHIAAIEGGVIVPIFADVRVNFLKHKISPFVDYKVGASVGTWPGFYTSLIGGCKLNKFNVGLGFTLGTTEMYYYGYGYSPYYYTEILGGFTLRLGFEF